jgi:large subunit ribosomal protein L6
VTEKKVKNEIKENIVEIPSGITVKIDGNNIILEKGSVVQVVPYNHVYISIENKNNSLVLKPNSKKKPFISVSNTVKKIILNALAGFTKDYICKMQIVYSHFPMTAKVDKKKFIITNFYGEKKPRVVNVPEGVKVDISGKEVTISGKDKQKVGQVAGNIESIARLKQKDYRVFDDGIYIVEKAK